MDIFSFFTPDGVMLQTSTVITVIALMFMYTFVGICAGFGGGLTTMPLISMLIPLAMATSMLVPIGIATALYATWLSRKDVEWKSAFVLIAFSFLGIPVGIYALSNLPNDTMKMILGVFLIVYSFYSLFVPRLPKYDKIWIAAPLGATGGALGGAFSTNGPPVIIYGMLRQLAPSAFRGTLNAFFTASNITILGGLVSQGIMTTSTLKLVMFCVPTMILGAIAGQFVHKRIPPAKFRVLVFLLLIASGSLLTRGALGFSALEVLLPTFSLLALAQILFGKKIASIRAAAQT